MGIDLNWFDKLLKPETRFLNDKLEVQTVVHRF